MVKFYICSCFLAQVWLFCLLQCFNAEIGGINFHAVWNYYIPSCIPNLQKPQTGFCRESSATSKFDDCSCFQTRSDSSAYSSVSVLKLMRQSFVAYENTASPLACPTGRSPNKSLQRELCNVEVWCMFMFFRSGLALQPTMVSLCWNWWEIFFIAYATYKSPLAFPTCRAINGFL